MKKSVKTALLMGAAIVGGSIMSDPAWAQTSGQTPQKETAKQAAPADNPMLKPWSAPFGAPPFDTVQPEHIREALNRGMAEQTEEVARIVANKDEPTFENTIVAMERSGDLLERTQRVFGYLGGSWTTDGLEALRREMAPLLAKHSSSITLNPDLFRRIDTVFQKRDSLGLNAEQKRLVERYHIAFVRAGAKLAPEQKARMAEISQRVATLSTAFAQNVLADEKAFTLVLETPADLAGLPDFLVGAAAEAARQRGMEGKHVITLSRSLVEPFLTYSTRRDLREKAFKGWASRGDTGGKTDNKEIIREIVELRAERARMMGYPTFAHFRTDDVMAGSPDAALKLMQTVWDAALKRIDADRKELEPLARADGITGPLEPWDWRFYAEKLRKAKYDLDEAEIKPYFQLEKMIEAKFYVANRLFGLTFEQRKDIPVYSPDVLVYEVKDKNGRHVALFYADHFSRPQKRSGAWASNLRPQHKVDGAVTPIIANNNNFAKGEPTLLSYDDAETLFHEFGHGLHGILSNVTYPMLSGTATDRDFLEFPAQIYEHWLAQPEILKKFAVHYKTGEPMPQDLIDRIVQARTYGEGFATVEYLSSAFVDMELHLLKSAEGLDVAAFERNVLQKIGMPREIIMRHRTPHFQHIFSGEGYAAGYYTYMWAEQLDTDGFEAFLEAGNIFDPATAKKLHDYVYSAGNTRGPVEAYVGYRGRLPTVEPLLRHRGFLPAATQ